MKDLFSDFEDLAHVISGEDHTLIKMAIEIVYLKGKLDGYVDRIDKQTGHLEVAITSLEAQLTALLENFAGHSLGLF